MSIGYSSSAPIDRGQFVKGSNPFSPHPPLDAQRMMKGLNRVRGEVACTSINVWCNVEFESTQPRRIFWIIFWANKRVSPVAASDFREKMVAISSQRERGKSWEFRPYKPKHDFALLQTCAPSPKRINFRGFEKQNKRTAGSTAKSVFCCRH